MEHKPSGSLAWNPSSEEHFTGSVWNSRLNEVEDGITLLAVQFAPGARTHWHRHPGGQVLYVISGAGVVRTEDGSVVEVESGDVVYAPPGERHWHGAQPGSPMMHLSLTTDGPTQWEDKVGDEEYSRR